LSGFGVGFITQREQRGTGHAVLVGREVLEKGARAALLATRTRLSQRWWTGPALADGAVSQPGQDKCAGPKPGCGLKSAPRRSRLFA